jgi:drug/metabolite transporter (DMT)-like permease
MLFACKGIFSKQLYARGVAFETVVTVRAVIALPLFLAFAFAREGAAGVARGNGRAIAAACFAGFVCYYIGAMLDFLALTMIDASIERVLMFSYPAMIVVFVAIRDRRRPTNAVLGAIAMTYVGIILAVGVLDRGALRANVTGAALVILSALTFAIYYLIVDRYGRELGSARFTLFGMGTSAVALTIHFLVVPGTSALRSLDADSLWLLIVLGTLCMFVPALLQAEGVSRIGAERAAIVSTMGPPTTILLGWAVLGERMSPSQLGGAALIVLGILLVERARIRALHR